MDIAATLAKTLNLKSSQVNAAIQLLNDGATVPFIARYRKEATGGLTDEELRNLHEKFIYFNELSARKDVILKSIDEQGKLTPTLKQTILKTENKTELEDLYLPYKPKRRTKADIAKEAGILPLSESLLKDHDLVAEVEAEKYINKEKGFETTKAVLEGAQYILAERFSENADLLKELREIFNKNAIITSELATKDEESAAKFKDYFEFSESIQSIPAHRILALFRGRKEGALRLKVIFPSDLFIDNCTNAIANAFDIPAHLSKDHWLSKVILWTWKIKLHTKLEVDVMVDLKARADEDSIQVFANNLKNLLMTAPAGNHVVLGLDPGYRTGVKTVVIDGTGKLLTNTVIFPHAPQKKWDDALHQLKILCEKFKVTLISIGNGTASRETDELATALIKQNPSFNLSKIVVSEAGASIYSASALATKEFPDLDVSYRGAVSIARRLQDPLAELVKIDPKSIGVGQYQHDVNQIKLGKSLSATVEDCVNAVGADLNTASAPLLTSISGLNESIAEQIVSYRESNGRFIERKALMNVPRFGEKTFEQSAGFLRIINGENPLDASAVHPESYHVVEEIALKAKKSIRDLIGNTELINSLNPHDFVTDQTGLPTIKDIFSELQKPGRDPRPSFKMAKFTDGINEIADLKPGMTLEGVITNVANFGAFVDIGVHQDGLVHVSELSNQFVKDVHKVVSVGQIVSVRILEVDEKRKRISLSMKTEQKKPVKKSVNKPKAEAKSSLMGDRLKAALLG